MITRPCMSRAAQAPEKPVSGAADAGGGNAPFENPSVSLTIASINVPGPVKAGQSIVIPVTLENFSDAATEAVNLHGSDLVSTGGTRIPATQIAAPLVVLIPALGTITVNVTLAVPDGTPANTYTGLLQASEPEALSAVLTVKVTAATTGSQTTASIAVPGPVEAGQSIMIPMTLENSSDSGTGALNFHSSDLVGTSDARIPAQQIGAPRIASVPAHGTVTVNVALTVPDGTPAGAYTGLLQAGGAEQASVVLTVQVE